MPLKRADEKGRGPPEAQCRFARLESRVFTPWHEVVVNNDYHVMSRPNFTWKAYKRTSWGIWEAHGGRMGWKDTRQKEKKLSFNFSPYLYTHTHTSWTEELTKFPSDGLLASIDLLEAGQWHREKAVVVGSWISVVWLYSPSQKQKKKKECMTSTHLYSPFSISSRSSNTSIVTRQESKLVQVSKLVFFFV